MVIRDPLPPIVIDPKATAMVDRIIEADAARQRMIDAIWSSIRAACGMSCAGPIQLSDGDTDNDGGQHD